MEVWKNKTIGEVILQIADGGTPSRAQKENFGGDYCWIVIDDIEDAIYDTKEKLTELGISRCSSMYWPEGTVILSTGATIGEVGITKVKAATKQGISGIVVNEDEITNCFLKYFFQLNKEKVKSLAQGSTIKEVRPPVIKSIRINYPPSTKEQDKITEILHTADKAIEKTKKLIAKYQLIKTGLMQDLLTRGIDEHGYIRSKATHKFVVKKGIEVPEEWDVEELHNILAKPLTYGIVQPGNHNPDGIYIIRSQDYTNGWNSLDSMMKVSPEIDKPYERSRVYESDLLITVVGANVGRIAIVPILLDGANISRSVARMAIDRTINSSLFYYYYLLSRIDKYLRESTVGGAQPVLNLKELNTFKVVKPDLDEQKLIEQKLISINDLVIEEKKYLKKLHSLKTGLMQDLLSGRVRVKVNET